MKFKLFNLDTLGFVRLYKFKKKIYKKLPNFESSTGKSYNWEINIESKVRYDTQTGERKLIGLSYLKIYSDECYCWFDRYKQKTFNKHDYWTEERFRDYEN